MGDESQDVQGVRALAVTTTTEVQMSTKRKHLDSDSGMTYNSTIPGLRPEDQDRSRGLRWALGIAAAVHAVLFVIHFPNLYSPPQTQAQEVKVYRVERFRPKPPEVPPETPPPPTRPRKVPVPDPDPDAPEPLRRAEVPDVLEIPEFDMVALDAIPEAPPPPETGPIRITGDVKKPEPLYTPRPRYTEIARRSRIQGVVLLEAIIDTQGNVTDLRVLKGLSMGLTEEAEAAVKKWKYRPATLNGKPVAVILTLSVTYELQ